MQQAEKTSRLVSTSAKPFDVSPCRPVFALDGAAFARLRPGSRKSSTRFEMHIVIWSALLAPRAVVLPLSTGRSPALSTAAGLREPLSTQGRPEGRIGTKTGGKSVSAQQLGLVRGVVHRTGAHKLWAPHGRSQGEELGPNLKETNLKSPATGSYQRSSWASKEVAKVAATNHEREGETALPGQVARQRLGSSRLRHKLVQVRLWWQWQQVCSAYTYCQGWDDGAWLFEHGGRAIASAAASVGTRAATTVTRAACAARAYWCRRFGRQRPAVALSNGALPD